MKEIDEKEKEPPEVDQESADKVKQMEDDLEEFENELDEIVLASSCHFSDKRRFEFLETNEKSKAEKEANDS